MKLQSGTRRLKAILFVDDDPDVRKAFERLVTAHGLHVDLASNGEEAIEAAGEKPYAVIIADYQMPGLSGPELVARLRKIQPNACFMLITGHTDLAMQSCRVPGVSLVISKPWDPDALLVLLGVNPRKAETG
jgi:CheY-like chemotaxis protein